MGLPAWWKEEPEPTESTLNLGAEQPDDLLGFMDSLSVRPGPAPKRLPPAIEDLTQELDGIPTAASELRVIDKDTLEIVLDPPRKALVSITSRKPLGRTVFVGVNAFVTGIVGIGFVVVSPMPTVQYAAVFGWLGAVVLSMVIPWPHRERHN